MVSRLDYVPTPDLFAQQAFFARNVLSQQNFNKIMSVVQTAYDQIISLPADVVNGQISDVVLKGNTYNNFIKNGNFANGDNWAPSGGVESVANNIYTITGNGAAANPYAYQTTNYPIVASRKVFFRCLARVTNADCLNIALRCDGSSGGTDTTVKTQSTPTINTWYTLSGILTTPADFVGNYLPYIQATYADAATANGKAMEIKEVIAIDLAAHGLDALTLDQCNARFPYWFDGIKSTILAIRQKSVGKNLFDKSKVLLNKKLNNVVGGSISDSTASLVSDYISVIPGEQYTINNGISDGLGRFYHMYDKQKNNIYIGSYSYNHTFTIPSDAFYIRITFDIDNLDIAQFEQGNTATAYEPYKESVVYTPEIGRSLPNGVKDEVNVTLGQKIQRIKEKILQAIDVSGIDTNYTNVDRVRIAKPTNSIDYGKSGTNTRWTIFGNYPYKFIPVTDDAANIGYYCDSSPGVPNEIVLCVAKGTYATLAAAQAALAGTTLNYQLATPVVSRIQPQALMAEPGGTLIVEPVIRGVKKPAYSTGKITVSDANAPVDTIHKVERVDMLNGLEHYVGVTSSCTITDNGTTITIAGFDPNKNYLYECGINSAYSAPPDVEFRYPKADFIRFDIASKDYQAAAADWILSEAEAKTLLLTCTNAGAAVNIVAPDKKGLVFAVRNLSGQAVTIKKSDGTGVVVANAKTAMVMHNGTDYIRLTADV